MLNTVEKNDTLQLEAVVYPTDATNQAVSWSSSNPDVASVDADGTVTGAAPGKTVITAKTEDGGFTATREVECSGIALSKTSMTLLVNESESLSFPCYGAASGKNVVWSSSNPSVADAGGRADHRPLSRDRNCYCCRLWHRLCSFLYCGGGGGCSRRG